MLDLLKGFLPWIVFLILAGHSEEKLVIGIIAACITFAIFQTKDLFKGFILCWGTFLFFIFMLVFVVFLHNSWVAKHTGVFANGTLAVVAWFSLLIGAPFTQQYAKEKVDKKYWNTMPFIRTNQHLTTLWGTIFLFCLLLSVLQLYFPTVHTWKYEVASDGLTIIGNWITTWFPEWNKKRLASR